LTISLVHSRLIRTLLGPRSLGLVAIGLAAPAGVFTGLELDLAVRSTSLQLTHGVIYFWPVVLRLIGLVLDLAGAAVAVIGGGLMCLKHPTGRRLVVAALAAGIAGETTLAFVDEGQYTQASSTLWVGLLVGGYLLLIASALLGRWR